MKKNRSAERDINYLLLDMMSPRIIIHLMLYYHFESY